MLSNSIQQLFLVITNGRQEVHTRTLILPVNDQEEDVVSSNGHKMILRLCSPQILATFTAFVLQLSWQRTHELFEMSVFQRSPYLLVREYIERVQIHTQRSRKQNRILPIIGEQNNQQGCKISDISEINCLMYTVSGKMEPTVDLL